MIEIRGCNYNSHELVKSKMLKVAKGSTAL